MTKRGIFVPALASVWGLARGASPKELIILCLKKRQASFGSSVPNTVLERTYHPKTRSFRAAPWHRQAARRAKGRSTVWKRSAPAKTDAKASVRRLRGEGVAPDTRITEGRHREPRMAGDVGRGGLFAVPAPFRPRDLRASVRPRSDRLWQLRTVR